MTKFKMLLGLALVSMAFSSNAQAAIGSPDAKQGGTYKYNLSSQPTTLNALSSSDVPARQVQDYVMEYLTMQHPDTLETIPALATKWEVSKDEKTFIFTLREGVKWHDGKPLTAEDVKFSFDAIMHPKNKYKTAPKKPYFENIAGVEILAPNKVKFSVKKPYFNNFNVVANGLRIVPKHVYENPTKKEEKKLNKTLIGSGPYIFKVMRRGKFIRLVKNKNWWGNSIPEYKGMYNYDNVLLRFVKDSTIALQRLEKGDLNFLELTPEEFVKKTNSPRWGKSVFKVKTTNKAPQGYGFVGWNIANPLFASKNVRVALTHLFNRKEMIEKFSYNMSEQATGPLYKTSPYANKSVKPIDYDPKKALEILRKEGWKDTDGDMILDKMIDGKKVKFSFTILEPLQDFVKYLTIFKEDAKQAGIDVNIKFIEWNTFVKLLNERKFEAVRLAWGSGSVDWDPKQIWHSSSIENQGSNFVSYSNPKVDKLIDEARMISDREKRIQKLNQVFKLIAEDAPYTFLFNRKYVFYGHTKDLKRPKDSYTYEVGTSYWWLDK